MGRVVVESDEIHRRQATTPSKELFLRTAGELRRSATELEHLKMFWDAKRFRLS